MEPLKIYRRLGPEYGDDMLIEYDTGTGEFSILPAESMMHDLDPLSDAEMAALPLSRADRLNLSLTAATPARKPAPRPPAPTATSARKPAPAPVAKPRPAAALPEKPMPWHIDDRGYRVARPWLYPSAVYDNTPKPIDAVSPGVFVNGPIPKGHTVVAQDLGRGLRVIRDAAGFRRTYFPPGVEEAAAKRLGPAICDAMWDLWHDVVHEDTGYPLGLIAQLVTHAHHGTCDGEILAAMKHMHDAGHLDCSPTTPDGLGIWPVGKSDRPELLSLWKNDAPHHPFAPSKGRTAHQLLRDVCPRPNPLAGFPKPPAPSPPKQPAPPKKPATVRMSHAKTS